MKKRTYYILFLVSYLPLFIILFIQNLHLKTKGGNLQSFKQACVENWLPISLIAISILALFLAYKFSKNVVKYDFDTPQKVIKVKNTGVEYLAYLGTYIIPFIGMNLSTINDKIATLALLLLIALIYPRTNLIYANPTLALFKYNIYKVVLADDEDEEIVVITKENIKKNKSYRFRELADDIFYCIT